MTSDSSEPDAWLEPPTSAAVAEFRCDISFTFLAPPITQRSGLRQSDALHGMRFEPLVITVTGRGYVHWLQKTGQDLWPHRTLRWRSKTMGTPDADGALAELILPFKWTAYLACLQGPV